MKYTKVIMRLLWLLPVFACLSVLCSAQIRYVIKQQNAERIINEGMKSAFGKLGVVENPKRSNSGKDVELFLHSVDLSKGNPWCAAFCQWAYQTASAKMNVKFNLLRSGHSLTLLHYARRNNMFSSRNPLSGDWVIFRKGETSHGHCALLVSIGKDSLLTLEGNTSNPENNNEGVFLKKHSFKKFGWMTIKGYIGFGE